MTPSLKRKVTIGVVAGSLACLAGGGAYAATQTSPSKTTTDPQQAFLSDVAGRLHVSVTDLQAALKGAVADQVNAAAKAGKLTQAQADAITKKIQQGAGVPFPVPFFGLARRFEGPFAGKRFAGPMQVKPFPRGLQVKPFAGGIPPLGPPRLLKAGLDAASKYLGLSAAQIEQQVRSGKSLADIAKAQSKSVDGLTSAIKDAVKSQLDSAVSAKKLTQAEETKILGMADAVIPRIVNGMLPKIGRPGLFFHPRFHAGP